MIGQNSDFSILITIFIVIGSFAIGIPLGLWFIDTMLCGKLFGCKMSICECVANYICCCFCIKKSITNGDDEVIYNLFIQKFSAKIAPL